MENFLWKKYKIKFMAMGKCIRTKVSEVITLQPCNWRRESWKFPWNFYDKSPFSWFAFTTFYKSWCVFFLSFMQTLKVREALWSFQAENMCAINIKGRKNRENKNGIHVAAWKESHMCLQWKLCLFNSVNDNIQMSKCGDEWNVLFDV